LGAVGDLDVAPGGAALLRQAASVLRDHALAVQVRRHAQQRADGDDAGAADTAHHDAPGGIGDGEHGLGNGRQAGEVALLFLLGFSQSAAFHRDKAGAKAVHARIVFVAAALVDAALAPQRRFDRLDAQAVALDRAVAAALAHRLVDDHGL